MPPIARRLLVGLLVLVVVLIGLDRVGDFVAERAAANTIRDSQHLSARPDVNIAGFPFLTQLAGGDFDRITITADDVPVGRSAAVVDLAQVRVVLHDVHVDRDFSRVSAGHADATAKLTYAELSRRLGVQVRGGTGGRITASKEVTVAGHTLRGTVSTRPRIADGVLSFGATRVNDVGRLGQALTSVLSKVFDLEIPFDGIPFRIRVRTLEVGDDGLDVALTGNNLSYTT